MQPAVLGQHLLHLPYSYLVTRLTLWKSLFFRTFQTCHMEDTVQAHKGSQTLAGAWFTLSALEADPASGLRRETALL